jgi:acetylglutamate kinase
METLINKAEILLEALPYFQMFRGAVVVIKFGGSAMEKLELTKSIMRDIVMMECIGMRPVVVHGGGKAISAKLAELKIPTEFINGLRYTCNQTISVVDDVLHNTVNKELVEAIQESGGQGVTLSGKSILKAEKMFTECKETGKQLDLGFVGDVSEVQTEAINKILDQNLIPVIAPLALGDDKNTYNINADIAACKIAKSLKARKLVFLSDVPGILQDKDDESSIISSITVNEVDNLINNNVISGGMAPKIKSAEEALRAGTKKVHIIDGRIKHSLLLEIFTKSGIGTEITN